MRNWTLLVCSGLLLMPALGPYHGPEDREIPSGPKPAVPEMLRGPAPAAGLTGRGVPLPASACATGCAIASHAPPVLSKQKFKTLLRRYAVEPLGGAYPALETLLFHGPRTRELLSRIGTPGLDRIRAARLRQELSRAHVRLGIRVVDEHGTVRVRLGPVRVPLGRKQHLHARHTERLQAPVISGTVYRVGLDHLWVRL